MTIIFPDTIPWDDETQWRKFNLSPFGRPAEGDEPRRWPLTDMPDGTIFKDERGHEYGKVAGEGVGRVVVVNDEGFFCMFDGRFPFIFADPSEEPFHPYAVVVMVEARDAEEARTFVRDELNDVHWDTPLEVRAVSDAFAGIPEEMVDLGAAAVTIEGEFSAGHEGRRDVHRGSRELTRVERS